MINITHIMWGKKGKRSIGIAIRKLMRGDNEFVVSAKSKKNGERYYPGTFVINREQAIEKYGVESINAGLIGVTIPTDDLELYKRGD